MVQPAGEAQSDALRLDFDRRLKLEFHGSSVTSDAGLLADRELDDALGLMAVAGQHLVDGRTGLNGRHDLVGMLRQSVFGRLAGYEDVNDADRLGRDPAMRWVVGGKAALGRAASPSQMGRFETKWLTAARNLSALGDLSGQWIDCVQGRYANAKNILSRHGWFPLNKDEAEKIVDGMKARVEATWYETARASGVSAKEAGTIRGAFAHPEFSL